MRNEDCNMNIAVILAGGIGSRVGADRPKQFIEVLGKPIIAYTLDVFEKHPEVDAIEVVCVATHMNYLKNIVNKYNFDKVKWIVEGGSTFQKSVMNGINNLKDKISKDDTVLVHFGASPFLEDDIISDAIKVSKEKGNAISTIPFYLLAGIKDNDYQSSEWIDRETIACMSSPHAFNFSYICDLYEKAEKDQIIKKIGPHTTTLMHEMGETIYFSKGSQSNIKITTKEDLDLFEGYVLMKRSREKKVN